MIFKRNKPTKIPNLGEMFTFNDETFMLTAFRSHRNPLGHTLTLTFTEADLATGTVSWPDASTWRNAFADDEAIG